MAHEGGCYSLAFSRNGMLLASGGADKTVKLWEPSTATLTSTLHVRLWDCLPVLQLLRCCCQLCGTLSSSLSVWWWRCAMAILQSALCLPTTPSTTDGLLYCSITAPCLLNGSSTVLVSSSLPAMFAAAAGRV